MITIATHVTAYKPLDQFSRIRLLTGFAQLFPEAHVIFILDSASIVLPPLPANCTVSVLGPEIKNSLLRKYYYEFKLPPLLQRYNAGVFIPGGPYPARTALPQFLLVHKTNLPKHPPKIKGIISIKTGETDLQPPLPVINVLPGADLLLQPIPYEEKIKHLDSMTGGDEFFLAMLSRSSIGSFMALMKGFSNFRKWQRSSMKLLLACEAGVRSEVEQKLSNYKYRNAVIIKDAVEIHDLLPPAYAFINVEPGSIFPTLDAFACNVPVISLDPEFHAELAAQENETSISEKMMILYKEELTRLETINEGRKLLETYDWRKSLPLLLEALRS